MELETAMSTRIACAKKNWIIFESLSSVCDDRERISTDRNVQHFIRNKKFISIGIMFSFVHY